ncbi:unnamed protein product [Effrenium voratum]|uniref:Pentatricopeptide repeat-containing protein, chloroplastic n=1 Tax=Effrenium voratum TaxID=2562239 RepID=A0AA36NK52_9DINO|nr:unnamed protein product [Effrenium voratum]CAJ1417687.1 unnamed protein product [Effrenium voratum]
MFQRRRLGQAALKQIWQQGRCPTPRSYERLLNSALQSGRWQLSAALIQETRSLGLAVSSRRFCLQLARLSLWQRALLEPGSRCDDAASAVLGACLLENGAAEKLELKKLQYNHLFAAAQGDWERMLALLVHLGRLPQFLARSDACIAYNMVLKASASARHWESALALLNNMHQNQVVPSVLTLGTSLAVCERLSKWSWALQMLADACKSASPWQHTPPNEICFNTAIASCQHAGHWQWSLHLVWDMHRRTLQPDSVGIASAVRSASHPQSPWAGRIEELLLDMKKTRLWIASDGQPRELGGSLLSRFGVGAWHRALGLSLTSDAETLNSALALLRRGKRGWALGLRLMQHPSADAISTATVVPLQEECQQLRALHSVLPQLVRHAHRLLADDCPSVHCSNGKTVAINNYDILAALGEAPFSLQLALARSLQPLLYDLRSLRADRTRFTPKVAATAGMFFTREA